MWGWFRLPNLQKAAVGVPLAARSCKVHYIAMHGRTSPKVGLRHHPLIAVY